MNIREIMSNQREAVARLRSLRENRKPAPPVVVTKPKPVIVKPAAPVVQETAAPVIHPLSPGEKVTLKRCIRIVSARYGVWEHLLLKDDRRAEVVQARWVLFYVLRTIKGWSLPEIGRRAGGRDHTTVLNGYQKITAKMIKNPAFGSEVEGVVDEILGR